MRDNLETHEKNVDQFGDELIKAHPGLSSKDRTITKIAIKLHDIGKMDSLLFENYNEWLLKHHKRGSDRAGEMLEKLKGQKINGVEVNEKMIIKVKEAIDRHMNHPYLILMNKGERFPEAEDDIDRTVSDADMVSNVGFKNITFRFNEKDMNEDQEAAKKKGITILEANFENVMEGVKVLDEYVYSDQAKEKVGELIEKSEEIFQYFKKNDIFRKVQAEFSDQQGNFSIEAMQAKFGKEYFCLIKKRFNEEIAKAGSELGIDKKVFNNFKI
ncbi:hypothetical protein KKH07_00495 [Patescibacteria group bacterium]|nr:hypothetical protein [Patescibacteria group bacterium]MBU1563571.1 hypothetical protein [Patescibacteria group bacterium]